MLELWHTKRTNNKRKTKKLDKDQWKKQRQFNTFQSCQSSLLETRPQETKEQSQPWSPTKLRSHPATAKTLNSNFINETSSESTSDYVAKKDDSVFSLTCPRRLRVAWKYAELAPTIISRAQITWIPIIRKKVWHQAQSFFLFPWKVRVTFATALWIWSEEVD